MRLTKITCTAAGETLNLNRVYAAVADAAHGSAYFATPTLAPRVPSKQPDRRAIPRGNRSPLELPKFDATALPGDLLRAVAAMAPY